MPAALQYLRKHSEPEAKMRTVKRPPLLKSLRILKVIHGETPPVDGETPLVLVVLDGETPPPLIVKYIFFFVVGIPKLCKSPNAARSASLRGKRTSAYGLKLLEVRLRQEIRSAPDGVATYD